MRAWFGVWLALAGLTGCPDGGAPDASATVDGGSASPDAGLDAGLDAGVADAAVLDAGPPDAAASDAGRDAGPPDADSVDSGWPDAAPDAGVDAGPPDAALPCFEPLGAWPGPATADALDALSAGLSNDMSGLVVDPTDPTVFWAAQNGPGRLHRFVTDVTTGLLVQDLGWGSPRDLRFAEDAQPDAEGVTIAADGSVYVASERNAFAGLVSRLSILRYDPADNANPLVATHEWDVTAMLAAAGTVVAPNAGFESVAFLPDDEIDGRLGDARTGLPYDSAVEPPHGGGLFAAGIEGTGRIHVLVLALDGGIEQVTDFASGAPATMGLEFDRETGALWTLCDSTCNNTVAVLTLDGAETPEGGNYQVTDVFLTPADLPYLDHEGIALGPWVAQTNSRAVYFIADGAMAGATIHRTWLDAAGPCAP